MTEAASAREAHAAEQRSREDLVEELLATLPDLVAVTGRVSELVADRVGVGSTDLQCLHFLNQHGPASPGELARRVGRTTGAVTRMIDRLEQAGFVERHRRPEDRRGVEVRATAMGIERIASYFDDIAAAGRADLAEHDRDQLTLLLDFVRASTAGATRQMQHLLDEPPTSRGSQL